MNDLKILIKLYDNIDVTETEGRKSTCNPILVIGNIKATLLEFSPFIINFCVDPFCFHDPLEAPETLICPI